MGFFSDIGTFISDGYDTVSNGLSDAWSGLTDWGGDSSVQSLQAPEVLSSNWTSIANETPSFWDSLSSNIAKEASQPSTWLNLAKGGYSAYVASQASDRQDKQLKVQEQERKDANELARLNILLQMEKEKYNLAAKGASGSGGGADRQIQMINALNASANTRITALNNLSSSYILALRGRS